MGSAPPPPAKMLDRPPRRDRGAHRAGGRGEGHDIQPVSAIPPGGAGPASSTRSSRPGCPACAGSRASPGPGGAECGGRDRAGGGAGRRRRPLAAAPRAARRRRRPPSSSSGLAIVARVVLHGAGDLSAYGRRPRRGARCGASCCAKRSRWVPAGWPASGPGELSLTATRGLRSLHTYYARYLPQAAAAAVIPVILLAWVATQDWLSFVVVVVLVVAVPVTMVYFGRESTRRSQRQWRRLGSLAGRFLQLVEGLPTLRAFGREQHGRREVEAATEGVRSATMRTLRVAFLSALSMDMIAGFGVGFVAMVLGLRLLWGELSLQTAMAVLLVAPGDLHPAAPGGRRIPRQHRGAGRGGARARGAGGAGPGARAGHARPGADGDDDGGGGGGPTPAPRPRCGSDRRGPPGRVRAPRPPGPHLLLAARAVGVTPGAHRAVGMREVDGAGGLVALRGAGRGHHVRRRSSVRHTEHGGVADPLLVAAPTASPLQRWPGREPAAGRSRRPRRRPAARARGRRPLRPLGQPARRAGHRRSATTGSR